MTYSLCTIPQKAHRFQMYSLDCSGLQIPSNNNYDDNVTWMGGRKYLLWHRKMKREGSVYESTPTIRYRYISMPIFTCGARTLSCNWALSGSVPSFTARSWYSTNYFHGIVWHSCKFNLLCFFQIAKLIFRHG